jgi:hypothetical protein
MRPFIVALKPMTLPLQPLRPRLGDRHDVRRPILRLEEGSRRVEPRHIVVDRSDIHSAEGGRELIEGAHLCESASNFDPTCIVETDYRSMACINVVPD